MCVKKGGASVRVHVYLSGRVRADVMYARGRECVYARVVVRVFVCIHTHIYYLRYRESGNAGGC